MGAGWAFLGDAFSWIYWDNIISSRGSWSDKLCSVHFLINLTFTLRCFAAQTICSINFFGLHMLSSLVDKNDHTITLHVNHKICRRHLLKNKCDTNLQTNLQNTFTHLFLSNVPQISKMCVKM